MACPLFLPERSIADYYRGECAAQPGAVISDETLQRCCNRGYASAACGFAANSQSDAIRLLIKADHGAHVEIAWSLERNHHPVAVGTLSVEPEQLTRLTPLDAQASALAQAYLEHKRNSA